MRNKVFVMDNEKRVVKLLTVTCIILLTIKTYAQEKKNFIVNPGQKISDVVSANDIYRYIDFKPGMVYFKDRRESSALLNYNRLLNEIQFINTNGDTLSIADENLIKMVKVDNDTFCYNKGFYELISNFKYLRLVRKETISMVSANKIGAYNQPVQGGAASSYTSYSLGGRNTNLVVNEKITLKKEVGYYFIDQEDHVISVSKKVLEKEFPNYSAAIEQYLTSNSVDFKNEIDLKKLIIFLEQYKL